MMKILLFPVLLLMAHVSMAQELAAASHTEVDAMFHKGEQAYNSGGYAKAIDIYTQVLTDDPEYLNAYLQRGFCHSLQREYEAAVTDFTAVIERKKDHLWAYTSRGSAYGKLGKQDLAIRDFNTVLQLDPGNEEAYNNRGWANKAQGNTKGACADWLKSKKMGNAEAKIILQNNRCK